MNPVRPTLRELQSAGAELSVPITRGWPSTTGASIRSKPSKARMPGDCVQARGSESPVDEVIAGVDLSGLRNVHSGRRLEAAVRRSMGLQQHTPAVSHPAPQYPQQSQRILDSVQDPKAEHEIEGLVEVVEVVCIETVVLHLGVEQAADGGESLASLELHAEARADPLHVLLVVDRHHPSSSAGLGQKGVEPVEGADVEHGKTLEVGGQGWNPIAMVASGTVGVGALRPVEREGVKPKRNPIEDGCRSFRVCFDAD